MTPLERKQLERLASEAHKAAQRLRREARTAPERVRVGLRTAAYHYEAVARETKARLRKEGREP